MRLINTKTLKLEEFFDHAIPKYAILSHTWDKDEVLLTDVTGSLWDAKDKAGFTKIENCCRQAVRDGWEYAWVDTCCIDKRSSAELSESINSMFRYYKEAQVCYAYLSDVPPEDFTNCDTTAVDDSVERSARTTESSAFSRSRWFTRGWTLQELLAPDRVVFYNSNWESFGTKSTLRDEISSITSIDDQTLNGRSFDQCSVARRMSWAARRKTTRVEDTAYCLMGIFDVNMPLLYGEGNKAFERLQREIMMKSTDRSLLAWRLEADDVNAYHAVLARSPAAFATCHSLRPCRPLKYDDAIMEMTNLGLRISLPLWPWYRSKTSNRNIPDPKKRRISPGLGPLESCFISKPS
ncbi:HET-domain-containing protein [Pseudovirgaria hyperparasitica]|uniref:HET-domain-containing protein n=1 Tax=Pseudovirgaria hyperparasitica TaxID=470096 RepID=A0A6A6W0P2_9PEZI|nr:HET-domain-containing protein [Pseudovirgaria hyperparasitica]KAF2756488.1 HET-domain-containing protein [Pseudovirgaria hyperparasitica]